MLARRNAMDFFDNVSLKCLTKESQTQVTSNVIALADITGCRARFYSTYLPHVMIIP